MIKQLYPVIVTVLLTSVFLKYFIYDKFWEEV